MWNIERLSQLDRGQLKLLLTSRPYEQILSKFRCPLGSFPHIRVPGEEESETISQEVNHVIKYQVDRLAREKELQDHVKDRLAELLLKIPHRTYLWVYLVFDYLKTEHFKKHPMASITPSQRCQRPSIKHTNGFLTSLRHTRWFGKPSASFSQRVGR